MTSKHRLEKEDSVVETCELPEKQPKQPPNHAFHVDSVARILIGPIIKTRTRYWGKS